MEGDGEGAWMSSKGWMDGLHNSTATMYDTMKEREKKRADFRPSNFLCPTPSIYNCKLSDDENGGQTTDAWTDGWMDLRGKTFFGCGRWHLEDLLDNRETKKRKGGGKQMQH